MGDLIFIGFTVICVMLVFMCGYMGISENVFKRTLTTTKEVFSSLFENVKEFVSIFSNHTKIGIVLISPLILFITIIMFISWICCLMVFGCLELFTLFYKKVMLK